MGGLQLAEGGVAGVKGGVQLEEVLRKIMKITIRIYILFGTHNIRICNLVEIYYRLIALMK